MTTAAHLTVTAPATRVDSTGGQSDLYTLILVEAGHSLNTWPASSH